MKRFMNKRMAVIGLTVAVIAGVGGAAFAYFTTSGTGTGSGAVGTSGAFVFTVAPPSGYLYPDLAIGGSNIETTPFTVQNTGSGDAVLNQITISVANNGGSVWSSQTDGAEPPCTAADFSINGTAPGDVAVDNGLDGTFAGGQIKNDSLTLEMIDNGLNQDNCQGLTVPLFLTTAAPAVSNPNLVLDSPPPAGGSGWEPNPTYLDIPTIGLGDTATLTVYSFQPGATDDDTATITVSFSTNSLTFQNAGGGAVCGAVNVNGAVSSVTCTYSGMAHGASGVGKPFVFKTAATGPTSATAVITMPNSGTASETYDLNIS